MTRCGYTFTPFVLDPGTLTGLMGGMLTEEALILLATLGAAGLLALGIMELAWPSAPPRAERRSRVSSSRFVLPSLDEPLSARDDEETRLTPDPLPHVEPLLPRVEPVLRVDALPVVEPEPPAVSEASALEEPSAPTLSVPPPVVEPATPRRSTPRLPRTPRSSTVRRASRPAGDSAPGDDVMSASSPGTSSVEEPALRELTPEPEPTRARVLPVDTCLAMYNDGRYTEVVSLGSAALEVHARLAAVSDRPDEASALFDLVGLSKQELGDYPGARTAFRAAIRDAAPRVRPTYIAHLVGLIGRVTEGASVPADAEAEAERVRELRAYGAALDEACAAAPAETAAATAQQSVSEALSAACERLVSRVAAGEGDPETRALVMEILADDVMPGAWRERMREQLAAASSAEIGQLTAQAIRNVQDGKDGEALEALERAERLAAALPPGAVTDERREEFDRRLWWGYTKVGLRRVETENFEGAVEPLFHAIHLGGIDEERLAETRGVLVRAVEGVVDTRGPAIQRLAVEDPSAAKEEIARLSELLRSASDRGLTAEHLGEAFAKVAQLG